MSPFRIAPLVAISFLVISPLAAQTGTGIYPYGAYDSLGADTINIGNLNTHLNIPILNKPGRGMPFVYNLSYDGLIWTPGTSGWTLAQGNGWRGETENETGYISYMQTTSSHRVGSELCITTTTNNYAYHDTLGVAHAFPGVHTNINTCGSSTYNYTGTATDGSGYSISMSGGYLITAKNGQTFRPPVNSTTGAATVTDTNGNEISVDGSGNFTDTLGMVALSVSGSPATSLTYKDTSGTARSVTITYGNFSVQTAFGCTGVAEYGPTTTQLITAITFPDTSSYTFTYEPTPGVSGKVTGRLASVTLPTGGVIT